MANRIQKGSCVRETPEGEIFLVEEISVEQGAIRGTLRRTDGSTASFSTLEQIDFAGEPSTSLSREDVLCKVETCPLCQQSSFEASRAFQVRQLFWPVDVLVCNRCGLVFKQERLCDAWLERLYGPTYQHFRSVPSAEDSSRELRDRVRRIGPPRGRHLDYGCGNGSFVMAALGVGWDSIGCDPFLPVIDPAHPLAARLKQAGPDEVQALGTFDQITMWATVEHLSDLLPTFTCPHCHSTHVRRSRPHGLAERLLRGTTFFHFFRCRDCGHRGLNRGCSSNAKEPRSCCLGAAKRVNGADQSGRGSTRF